MASSSFSISGSNPSKYDVFLSFRGEDTRKNFTCHLNDALIRSGIVTFIDNREVETGDEISSTLSNAIRSSSLSVIIFSQNYASSSWCLNELLEIIECYETRGQIILPIFYHVSPSDIRYQNGTYGKAFATHEGRFTQDKVQKWRAALAQVAGLSGSELMPDDKQLETEFIEKIVKDVLAKLNPISSGDHLDPGLVGIRSRVEPVESLLCLGSTDICIIGIWGMGGIGKTTIATTLFKRIANQFDAVCFLENVKDDAKIGPNQLREKLLSGILGEGNRYPNDFTIRRLCSMKILIVIDDVNNSKHLKALVGDRSWFGPGSRIIVTSRDRQVLRNGVDKLYEVKGLNDDAALKLFCLNAFKQSHPLKDFMEMSVKVVDYAKGNPLALEVLGCSLLGNSMGHWKSVLDKLKKCPPSGILEVLKISYDMLDPEEREIFLFIACFFKGKEIMDRVINILDGCGFSTKSGISYLVDNCLLTITYDNRLSMHDLIQEMGRHVVVQESMKAPGKRSRLWDPQEICDLFKKNTGTEAIESISLDLSQISKLYISPDAFTRMPNLKLLKFYFSTLDYWRYDWCTASDDWRYNEWFKKMNNVKIMGEGLESLPDELRYVSWPGYPLTSLPLNPKHLVDLEMPFSQLQHLWKDTKFLGKKLRRIDLHESRELTEVPDLYQATNLESMQLGRCSTLTKFPKFSSMIQLCLRETVIEKVPGSAIKCLSKIVELDISSNTRLRNLPSMRPLTSLKKLHLNGCSNITEFPDVSGAITSLNLSGTAIEEVPYSTIKSLSKIVKLDMGSNTMLRNLPSMRHLTSLKKLYLGGCSNITEFPDVSGPEITTLDLSETAIEEVPSSVGRLTNLDRLNFHHCKRLKKVSSSIFELGLAELDLSGCSKLENFPEVLENEGILPIVLENEVILPTGVTTLDLSECNMEVLPSDLSPIHLSTLYSLILSGNEFESLSLEHFTSSTLKELNISNCKRLRRLQVFGLHLEVLVASNCTSLETLPDTNAVSGANCFYYFFNCFKLDESTRVKIQTDARLSTQLRDSDSERYITVKYMTNNEWLVQDGSASFCFPGSEIPEWFINQNQGSLIEIDLPPHWYSNKFVGFVVCIVASCNSQSSNHIDLTYVECQCKIKVPDCDGQDITFNLGETFIEHPKSDHVFIKSIMPFSVYADRDGKFFKMTDGRFNTGNSSSWQEARFRFSTSEGCCKVKKCGINLLYSEWEDQVFETVMKLSEMRKKKIATQNQKLIPSADRDKEEPKLESESEEDQVFETESEEEDCHSESEEDQVFETESEEEDCHSESEVEEQVAPQRKKRKIAT